MPAIFESLWFGRKDRATTGDYETCYGISNFGWGGGRWRRHGELFFRNPHSFLIIHCENKRRHIFASNSLDNNRIYARQATPGIPRIRVVPTFWQLKIIVEP